MLARFVPYVDFVCYAGFSFFRPLIPDIGDVYRDTLDLDTVATIEQRSRAVVTAVEEGVLPAVVRRYMEQLIENLLRTLSPETQRTFTQEAARGGGHCRPPLQFRFVEPRPAFVCRSECLASSAARIGIGGVEQWRKRRRS